MNEFVEFISETLRIKPQAVMIILLILAAAFIILVFAVLFIILIRTISGNKLGKKKSGESIQPPVPSPKSSADGASTFPKVDPKQFIPTSLRGTGNFTVSNSSVQPEPLPDLSAKTPSDIQPEAVPEPGSAPQCVSAPAEKAETEVNENVSGISVDIDPALGDVGSSVAPSGRELSSVADFLLAKRGPSSKPKEAPAKTGILGVKPKKKAASSLKSKAKQLKIPKTAQETIPYQRVYPDDGIIEIEDGVFTKTYFLDDINYHGAKDEEQTEMFLKFAQFLNSFDPSTRFQINIDQMNINMDEFEASTMLPMKGDQLDYLRVERNEMLKRKIKEGKNNMSKQKYLTVSVNAPDYAAAHTTFARLDSEIPTNIKKIGGARITPLTTAQRLELLHDIYNNGFEGMFGNNVVKDANGNYVFAKDKFRFDIMQQMGLTTKDMIAPQSFSFRSDYGQVGDTYFRALFVQKIPSFLEDTVLKDLTNTNLNMITSLSYEPVDSESALKMARAQIVNTNANMIDKQKKASKAGYSVDLINPTLKDAAEEADALFKDLTSKNQKLFYLTLVIVHFAETKEQLDSDTKSLQAIGRKLLISIKKLSWQQENGLNTALPLCNNKLKIKRSLTTESAAVFMPFENQELNDRDGGMYYGNNAVSHNLIMLNRRNSKNGNGFIFGTPGSGKSMSAKQEMLTVLLSSDDDVIVIDPEGEYYPMAEMLGGEVIRIANGTNVHINPFDLEMDSIGEDEPMSIKSDFIISICESIAGDRYGLNASQISLIDRCVKKVYEPYLNSYDKTTGKYDKSKLPTLRDFWDLLRNQNGYDAAQLADSLELYVTGSQNLFAYHTNVEYSKRFVVYDIKDIGTTMKGLGLLVVLDNIWNRIVSGRQAGKNVWFFIDEIYLLFKNESSAEFLKNLYKRARKYGGIPTGITQNVTDLLENSTARTMISNCEFIMMLNQAPLDRAHLGELLNISPHQLGYVTNSSPGHGLIYDGVHIVPFINTLPKETREYEAMTTRLSEVKEREKRKLEVLTVQVEEEEDALAPLADVDAKLEE